MSLKFQDNSLQMTEMRKSIEKTNESKVKFYKIGLKIAKIGKVSFETATNGDL